MALKIKIKKEKEGQDIDVSYWEIDGIYFNKREKHLTCELRGYESKTKRDEAEQGAKTDEYAFRFSMSGVDFPDVSKRNFINDIFAFIKKQNKYGIDWKKSVDA